jgi:hypothetical protein
MEKPLAGFGRRQRATLVSLALLAAPSVEALEWRLGEEIETKVSGAITLGSGIRTEEPRPENFGRLAGNRVGRSGGLTSANSGGPNLNFEQGKPFSTVLKGFADFDIHRKRFGAFARLKAWYDYELEEGDRPYGNFPNRFAQNEPLSDKGFAREAKFSDGLFTAAYVYGGFDLGNENQVDTRLGRQFLNWGTAQSITGGINVINPRDFAAAQRPGALPQETRIPVGMLYANLAAGKQWGLDGFVPYESRHDVLAGCGTYFNVATYAPTGCEQANVLTTINEPTALATGLFVHRAPDVEAKDSGEFGLSLRYAAATLGTEFRAYAINYHSRRFEIRGTNAGAGVSTFPTAAGVAARLTAPNGLRYALIYPEDVHLFGLSFDARHGRATRVFGEVAYRPNQPVSINFADVADAFVARNPNSILNRPASGKNALALPPGATFDAYDRFKVTTASLGINQGLPGILGSQRVIVGAELGWSHVTSLPDTNTIRYGRSDAYGIAAVPGSTCVDNYPGKTCVHEGFITRNAWGYRARIASTYSDTFLAGAALTPSFSVAHDVKGYSYDGTFLEDRMLYGPGLRAEWGRTFFAEIFWVRYSNKPRYSMLIDRDHVAMFTGVNF